MKFNKAIYTAFGAMAISLATANAEGGKVIIEEPTPIAAPKMIGANVSVGYDSTYMFYGVDYGQNSIWGSVEYSLPFTPEGVDLSVGAWYENPVDGSPSNPLDEDELDLYTTLTVDVSDSAAVWFRYAAYLFPEGGGNTNELGVGVDASVGGGMADVFLGVYYDFDVEGWYIQTGVSHTEQITDFFAVEIGTAIAYQVDYNSLGSDFNDVNLYLAFPLSLTENATLTPYIKQSWSLDAISNFQDDVLYGGVALSVDF